MNDLITRLMQARNCAHVHHWQTKSFSLHLALGELYDTITEFMDDLAEMYMGQSGETIQPAQSAQNVFNEHDALQFIIELSTFLSDVHSAIPQDPALINTLEELTGKVQRIKYKMEHLK